MGSLYLRGKTWWMKYHINGRPVRESTGTQKKMVAREVLKRVEADTQKGKLPYTHFQKTSFEDLAELIIQDYTLNGQDVKRIRLSVNNLSKTFSRLPVTGITSSKIQQYILARLEEGRANGTVNRELSALKRMLNLGAEQTPPLVDKSQIPKITMLKENNVRTGFFEHEEFLKVREALPQYLYGVITFGYKYGWRTEDITGITWAQVDRHIWTVRLEVGSAKNKKGRTVYLDKEMQAVFADLWEKRKRSGVLLPNVFLNRSGSGPIRDFRSAWDSAFVKTGVSKKIFHDLRRTAVRNMVRAGVPEKIAMQISGHKTRSVFDRYDIVNDRDLKMAAELQEKYQFSGLGTNLGTIADFKQKKTS